MTKKIQALVFAGASVLFVVLIVHAGVHGLIENLISARWAIGPSVLAWGLVYVCNTIAWRTLLDNAIPFGRAYAISIASFAINYVTPLVSLGGEPFRLAAASAWVDAPRATASVVGFRVIHTIGQLIFWITAIPLAFYLLPRSPATTASLITLTVIFTGLSLALLALFRSDIRIFRRWPKVDKIHEQLTAYSRRAIVIAVIAEYVGRCFSMLEYLFITRALGLNVDYPTAFMIGAFSQFVTNATFFIPFELGSKEASLSLIFGLLGLPADLGVYASIVSRIREMIWIAIGLTSMWAARRRA
ncbi:MAG TPA: lysylphosphatidylglycerol synthase transmembrane domain-containing protein [Gemmatimonadaceae bacterium]|nr:lysylphosphatidylglycerol synthase transmembrane domain-containing protein [Gemmatimonadaceae bacterium]